MDHNAKSKSNLTDLEILLSSKTQGIRFRLQINDRYILRHDGIWLNEEVNGDDAGLWICSPLTVKAMTRSQTGDAWGRVLSFSDQDGGSKSYAMAMEILAGDGLELRKELLRRGLQISQNRKARYHLMEYIQTHETKERVCCINHIGWHDDAFVLPQQSFYSA